VNRRLFAVPGLSDLPRLLLRDVARDYLVHDLARVAGWLWSYYYLRARRLGPIALSHAVLGTAYFSWLRGENLLRRWLAFLL
jgi:hypothetical protein